MDPQQLATWHAFLRAHSSMLRQITLSLEEAGLPPLSWYDVLAALRDAPENRLRQVELAEQVFLSNSGMSRLLDRVEKAGLVERVACPSDRRSFHVQLTAAGSEMLDRMWPVYAKRIAEDFMPALGSNPDEVRETLESIGRQCEVVKAAEAEVSG